MKHFMTPDKLLYLVTATDNTKRKAWYYVLVRPEVLTLFKRKLATKNLTLTEYGTIIESGYGETPPSAIAEKMRCFNVFAC